MLYLPERLVLWLGWITLSSALFTALPLGPYGLLGWLGAVGPLLRKVVPAVSARHLAAAILSVMLITVLSVRGLEWVEIILPPLVFVVGLLLAPVPTTGRERTIEGEGTNPQLIEEEFRRALNREVGRSRRYGRPMTLLSAACESPEKNLRTLEAAIASVVHIYALIYPLGNHLLVIVPELALENSATLKQRIVTAAQEKHLPAVTLSSVSFPDEEITSAGLIASISGSHQNVTPLPRSPQHHTASHANGKYGTEPGSL